VAAGGHPRVAKLLLVDRRRVAIWVRQSDAQQVVDHLGSRREQLDQARHLTPYGVTSDGHPLVTVFDAVAETARRASGLTRDDLGAEAAAARARARGGGRRRG
jgi:hypothetical protein